jgi:hypothetical protein
MPEIDKAKPWYKNLFEVIPLRNPVVELIRPFTKWFFDVLKNFITATAVVYLGKKTGSTKLQILGYFSSSLIALYIISYAQTGRIDFSF